MKTSHQEIESFENVGALQRLIAGRREAPRQEVRQRILRALIHRTCSEAAFCTESPTDSNSFQDFWPI